MSRRYLSRGDIIRNTHTRRHVDSIPERRSWRPIDKDLNKSWKREYDPNRAEWRKRDRNSLRDRQTPHMIKERERRNRRYSRVKTPAKISSWRKDDMSPMRAKRDRDDKHRKQRNEKDSDRHKHRDRQRQREASDNERKKRKRKDNKEKKEEKNRDTDIFTPQRKTLISETNIRPSEIRIRENVDETANKDDVLELYSQELDKELCEFMPELSGRERDEELNEVTLTNDPEAQVDKNTQDVLKRAENSFFAISPIGVKRSSSERFQQYTVERVDKRAEDVKKHSVPEQIKDNATKVSTKITFNDATVQTPPTRISVKARLGCKMDDFSRILDIEKYYDHQQPLSPYEMKSHFLRQPRCDKSERSKKCLDRKYRSDERENKKENEFLSERNRESARSKYRRRQSRPRCSAEKSMEQLVGHRAALDSKGRYRLRERIDEKETYVKRERDCWRDRRTVKSTRTPRVSRRSTARVSNDRCKGSRRRSGSRHRRDRIKGQKQQRDKSVGNYTPRRNRKGERSQMRSAEKATCSRERKRADDQSSSRPEDVNAPPSNDTDKTLHLKSVHKFSKPPRSPEGVNNPATETASKSSPMSSYSMFIVNEANFVPDYEPGSEHEENQQADQAVEKWTGDTQEEDEQEACETNEDLSGLLIH